MYTGLLALFSSILPKLPPSKLALVPVSEIAVVVTTRERLDQLSWCGFLQMLQQHQTEFSNLLGTDRFEWVLADESLTLVLEPAMPFPFEELEAMQDRVNALFLQFSDANHADLAPLQGQTHLIEVSYGGPAGEDLPEVARLLGISEREFVKAHSGGLYRVDFVGFLPGFAYLAELPAALQLARRNEPRDRVPAGALAVANRYTAIYPVSSPGGWHLVGESSFQLFDPALSAPNRLQPGDSVRFVEV